MWGLAPAQARDRSSRKKAFAIWRRQKLEQSAATIASGLSAWKASAQWKKQGGEFIPGLHRWLAEEKWLEPPSSTAATDSDTSHFHDPPFSQIAAVIGADDGAQP